MHMALLFPPRAGDIVLCRFPDCLEPPEMIKARPVVIVSPRLAERPGLCCVVPLSTTPPSPQRDYHLQIPIALMPRSLQAKATRVWAKCDMLYTLSLTRLDRLKAGVERATGRRRYEIGRVPPATLAEIRRRAIIAVGFPLQTAPGASIIHRSPAQAGT